MRSPRNSRSVTAPSGASRLNNLDAIRLAAALTVVVGHAWPLTGTDGVPRVAGIPIFTLAVYVFFATSGFLITKSWHRLADPSAYLRHRAARIFPALIVLVVVTALVVGPVATSLPLDDYLAASGTWSHLSNVTLVASYDLPGAFSDHARPVVNGSLWTLGPEFLCYLAVLGIGLLARAIRPDASRMPGAVITAAVAIAVVVAIAASPSGTIAEILTAAEFFAIGSVLAHVRPAGIPAVLGPIAILAWLIVGTVAPAASVALAWLAIPVAVVSLGLRATPFLRRAGRFGDVSYGIYLWGYLPQQLLLAVAPGLNVLALSLLAVILTVGVAALSWHLVERPALEWARRPRPLRAFTPPRIADAL